MRLHSVRIENFRSFKDQTVKLDEYTCLVGPNGAGKSAVLTALAVFFRDTKNAATDVLNLTVEDFHHRDTSRPVKITLTFDQLSTAAQADLKHYFRHGLLVVSAKAEWDDESQSADVKQFGSRLVMYSFAPFFKAIDRGERVPQLREEYRRIREQFPELPDEHTKNGMEEALREYEEARPDDCELLDDTAQFYGWSRGENLLSKYLQWVYIPAVKDASTEQEESSKTVLGQLLERTVRSRVNFKNTIAELRDKLEVDYKELIDKEKATLSELESSIKTRLRRWANPAVDLALNWHYDRSKSLTVAEPVARISIGEDNFLGEVPRVGHGMQRSFLLAVLQELASSDQETGPTLLLGFEEPELYQHPPQAQHIASVLQQLAATTDGNAQIILTTHSPYFVSAKGFENVRLIRKCRKNKCSIVRASTYEQVEQRLSEALDKTPCAPSVLMTKVEQIVQPSQRELFFTPVVVLVEGIEDVAFISTHLQLTEKWNAFREKGCHFVVCAGKSSLSRPLAIARDLGIPCFTVFDSDADETNEDQRRKHSIDNACVLRLCGLRAGDFEPLPIEDLWSDSVVMWRTNIADVVRADVGEETWDAAERKARDEKGFNAGVRRKNNMLIIATLEQLDSEGTRSSLLSRLCGHLLKCAEGDSR